jgi:hypothetical protein
MYIVNPQGQLIYAGGIDSIPSQPATTSGAPPITSRQAVGEAAGRQAA